VNHGMEHENKTLGARSDECDTTRRHESRTRAALSDTNSVDVASRWPAASDDLYVFSGDGSTVFIMDVNSTITGVHVKPGFHHEARYEFKVHFDGADFETLTYRVYFGEPGADGR
jgi:hypothetical protein